MNTVLFFESTFAADFHRLYTVQNCSFYKPIKLRPLQSDAEYFELRKGGFYNFPYSYSRFGDCFPLFELAPLVFDRFVQLLAPLTLFHLSKSSTELYYTCLDARGLLFKTLKASNTDCTAVGLGGFEGMLWGYCTEEPLLHYKICYSHFEANLENYSVFPKSLDFVTKYKKLELRISTEFFKNEIVNFCEGVFHPGVEYLQLTFLEDGPLDIPTTIHLKNFEIILEYSQNVKTFEIFMGFTVLPQFFDLKDAIESWALRTTRLETFIMCHGKWNFQLHEKQLKRCVRLSNGKWYWVDNCDVENNDFEAFVDNDLSSLVNPDMDSFVLRTFIHYDDIIREAQHFFRALH